MTSSSSYEHTFYWEGNANTVIIAGSFDNWSGSLQLLRPTPSKPFSVTCPLPFGLKVYYKYVVDGVWQHSPHEEFECDQAGNVNNVFTSPPLFIPQIPCSSNPLVFTTRERNFQLYRFDPTKATGKRGGGLDVLAGLHLSPPQTSHLTYASLRTLLDLILDPTSTSAYKFGRLCSPSSGSSVSSIATSGDDESEECWEIEVVEEEDEGLERGFWVVVQTRKAKPLQGKPAMGGLGLGMGSSRSTSEASFSTALSTNFSVSVLGSGHDDYICIVNDPSDLWELKHGLEVDEEEVRRLWNSFGFGFDPHASFLPLSFTPLADPLLPYISYKPPSTVLEKSQAEEFLQCHWLDCLNYKVRGGGKGRWREEEDGDEEEEEEEWEEAVVVG